MRVKAHAVPPVGTASPPRRPRELEGGMGGYATRGENGYGLPNTVAGSPEVKPHVLLNLQV